MPTQRVTIDALLAAPGALRAYDVVIDARSPSEFAEDHLPGAINWPTLDDAERAAIGTEYKQISAFDARKRGAVLAARNIAAHIERESSVLPKGWRPLVYCWRGGQRSGSLATVLAAVGWSVDVLEGGYREFRRRVVADLADGAGAGSELHFRVVCGTTGSGKSRLLAALQANGTQVLDLEALAAHRGSVLGAMPGESQPTQKAFETALWQALRGLDRTRPVYVESESRTIGRLRLPEALLTHMRASECLRLEMPLAARVALLCEDYAHFVADREALAERLLSLREVRGAAVVERWAALARSADPGAIQTLVADLLTTHYDPVYLQSIGRNFGRFAAAPVLELADGAPPTLQSASALLAL